MHSIKPNFVAMLGVLFGFFISLAIVECSEPRLFNVLNYGAIGDGVTDDSKAFEKTWNECCRSTSDYSILHIPNGKSFLHTSVSFGGPCKPSKIQVQIDGNLTAPTERTHGHKGTRIGFNRLQGLIVNGSGSINGEGPEWWKDCIESGHRECDGPTALSFHYCKNVQILKLQSINSARNHMSISSCSDVQVSNVFLSAPGTSPNTDGIDIVKSTNIRIQHSIISTGDDCIAINSGSSEIMITQLTCGPGHGISIGSLGNKGSYARVENIYVSNCTLIGTQNGARIKTWQGGSGYARNITFKNIILESTNNSIVIDQFYCPHNTCESQTEAVKISNVQFMGITGTSLDERAISLNCSKTVGCSGINLDNINIASSTGSGEAKAYCNNAHGKSYRTIPSVDCLLP